MTYVLSDEDRKIWACRTHDVDAHLAIIAERYPDRVAEMVTAQIEAARPIYDAQMASGTYRAYAAIKAERDAKIKAENEAAKAAFDAAYKLVWDAGVVDAGINAAKLALLKQVALAEARAADAKARQNLR